MFMTLSFEIYVNRFFIPFISFAHIFLVKKNISINLSFIRLTTIIYTTVGGSGNLDFSSIFK